MRSTRQLYGAYGEELAARWYEAHGYEVVARNWRCDAGELDVVVRRGRLVVFCEVKARRDGRYGTPGEAVTPARQRRLRRSASRFLADVERATASAGSGSTDRPRPAAVRFDVAEVSGSTISVIEAAF